MTDDIMARPDGTGSRASTEPASGESLTLVGRLRDWEWLCSISAAEQRATFSAAADMIERLASTPAS